MRESGRPDPDLLQQWVLDERMPLAEVGGRLGRSRSAGYDWLRRYAITAGGRRLAQDELVRWWRSGVPVGRIAAATGVPEPALVERLTSAALIRPARQYLPVGSAADPLPEHLLREWHVRQGLTAPRIAALTGTTARQVRYRLARYRLSRGHPGLPARLPEILTADLLRVLYVERGLTCPQIAADHGASAESVRRLLDRYGIERRPGGFRAHDAAVPGGFGAHDAAVPGGFRAHDAAVPGGFGAHDAAVPGGFEFHDAAVPGGFGAHHDIGRPVVHRFQGTLDRARAAVVAASAAVAAARAAEERAWRIIRATGARHRNPPSFAQDHVGGLWTEPQCG
ncbi:hypothetical protein AB0J83_22840 [Actinoplanes sp. NPDC049596]|uniref:hypothetical protein n=1 Tax=unclassified Actinoplanes TaxID=2626549 RepID=UPI00341C2A62